MPVYDYVCPQCSKKFEAIVTRDNRDRIICAVCNIQAERQISVGKISKNCSNKSCSGCSGCDYSPR